MSAEQPSLAVVIEDAGPCSKKVRITVPAERVDREIEDTYKNVQKAVAFKGFRPGKAPRKLVEARLGSRVLEDVRERLVQSVVEEAIREEKLETLGEAEADWSKIEVAKGSDLEFEVTIDVRPTFDVPDLSGVTVERPFLEVTDEMTDREIERWAEDVTPRGLEDDLVWESQSQGKTMRAVIIEASLPKYGEELIRTLP